MKKILMVAALGALSSMGLFAANTCSGPGASGTSLVIYSQTTGGDVNGATISNNTLLTADSSGSCTVNGFTFSNFDVYGVGTFTPSTPFFLSAVIDGNGIDFLYTNLGSSDIELEFEISPGITNMTLNDGSATSVTENICSNQPTLPGLTCTSVSGGTFNVTSVNPTTSVTVNGGADSSVWVVKDITGGSDLNQTVAPEPMTMSLMGFGLLGLGIFGRRFRK
jgi:hypothetical protein